MKRYPNYKDSGVEWLGEIPEHWDIIRIKRLSPVKRGASPRPIDNPKYFDDNGEFAWVRIADVTASNKYLLKTTQKLSKLGSSLSVKQYPDDLFISIAGSVGKPIITKIKCCIHDGFVYFTQLKINKYFIYYLFDAGQLFKGLGKFGTQLNLNTDTIGNIQIPLPPPEEQKTIAHFLDHKLEQIEQYIRNKKRLIELLNEQKTAIINRAVTKGINPNAPMKHSGIEWLGEIPAHWEVKRNKYIFKEVNERSTTGQETYLAMSQRLGLVERSQIAEQHLSTSENQIGYKLCQVNDLILNKLKAYLGVFFKASVSGLVSPDYTVFRPIADIEVEYFEYLFKTPGYIAEFNRLSTGIVIGFFRLYTPDFYTSYSIFPPVEEQTKIVNYIKHESTQIDLAIAQIEKEIELIQEYRTTLISDAVTGKIDVRGFDNSSNSKNSPKPPELATM